MARNHFFTSESVTKGHPDKVADCISDSVLDALIAQDKNCRVACETMVTTGIAIVAGEITAKAEVSFPDIIREAIREIGYTSSDMGFDYQTCSVMTSIDKQSPDIAQGVNEDDGLYKEQGAGDQGLMFGYATNETKEYMPLPIVLAHKLTKKLSQSRKSGQLDYLGPDGKSQITVEYQDGKAKRLEAVVVSNQHNQNVNLKKLKKDIKEKVILPVCSDFIDERTKFFINPTGRFVLGGPAADTGLTGRKIIVDTYGGHGSHGGGCFSGKDPSKVDRSASYAARYIAKNIVAAGLADKCEAQMAYAIGVSEPVSILINCFNTNKVDEEKISKAVRKYFPIKPHDIIKQLDLRRPIYRKTAFFGHFGRKDKDFTWENLDKVNLLKKEFGL